MKKLLTRILITACLFFIFDRALGVVLKSLYSSSNATDEYKISYSNAETKDSILFIGSSRCLHHYVPAIFEKELGYSCYNAGDWGIKNIYYHFGLLSNILERYTPKAIVLEIHPSEWLDLPFSGKERAGSLAPFCTMSEGCDKMLRLTGNYWAYRLSTTYRYTGSLPNLLAGKYGTMDRNLKGWKPLDGQIDTLGVVAEEYPFPVDEERVNFTQQLIDMCKKSGIQLVIAVSPMYVCSREDAFGFARNLAEKNHIPFFDHYRDSNFVGKKELFYDFGHMNKEGAKQYSDIVSKELKAVIH